MVVNIHQPDFIPWLGFFDRLAASDVYVVLDDVQLLRKGWHNRDRIKTRGGAMWLTVPVKKKGKYHQTIGETGIDSGRDWRGKHLAALRANYAKAPNFDAVFPRLEAIYAKGHERLLDLNMDLLGYCMEALGIKVRTVMASDFGVTTTGTARLVELVRDVGGDVYLSGTGAEAYLEEALFKDAGIRVAWQRFDHPVYPQLHGDFEPGLSAIDYLMNAAGPLPRPEVSYA